MHRIRSTAFSSTFRRFCSASSESADKIIASVVLERPPVVIPKVDPVVYAFQDFSFRWKKQFEEYPDESRKKNEPRGKTDIQIEYQPAPRITEADKSNDKRSLQRALDQRLYLLVHGPASGSSNEKPVWHFPEKPYENEETLRKCAESALKSVLGDLSHTYFTGNAPIGHIARSEQTDSNSVKKFFFKSQVVGSEKLNIAGCDDFVWVTKDELLEYFPEEVKYLNLMIIR